MAEVDYVKMHGPAVGNGEIVEDDVHPDNVRAFKAAGWVEGPIKAPVTDEAEAIAQSKPKAKK